MLILDCNIFQSRPAALEDVSIVQDTCAALWPSFEFNAILIKVQLAFPYVFSDHSNAFVNIKFSRKNCCSSNMTLSSNSSKLVYNQLLQRSRNKMLKSNGI